MLNPDSFCSTDTCECPGQVRWHSGHKMNQLRGVHMTLVYLKFLKEAVRASTFTAAIASTRELLPGRACWRGAGG